MPELTGSAVDAIVFAEDLDEEGLDNAKQSIADVFDDPPPRCSFSEMARRIRLNLDKRMDTKGWSVVVGRAFGAYITQKIKAYAYLSVYPGVNVLVWKA